jgi:hypothetical protein
VEAPICAAGPCEDMEICPSVMATYAFHYSARKMIKA